MNEKTAELRKVAQDVLANGISYPRASTVHKLLKEAKVIAHIQLAKKMRG